MILSSIMRSFYSKRNHILLGLLCLLIVITVRILQVPIADVPINRTGQLIYDVMMSFYPHKYKDITPVFVVDIDDKAIGVEGRWPWPRDKLAKLFLNLQNAGVVAVGVDIIMSNPEVNYAEGLMAKIETMSSIPSIAHKPQSINPVALDNMLSQIIPEVDNDKILAQALKGYDVTLGFLFHDLPSVRIGLLPQPLTYSTGQDIKPSAYDAQRFLGYNASLPIFIKASGHGGFVTNIPDTDGVIRHGFAIGSFDDKVYPSLALMAAMRFLLADHVDLKKHQTILGEKLYGLDVSGTFISTNYKGQMLIPYWGPQYSMPYISATDIIHNDFDASKFAGSVAIVGSSAIMLGDLHASPVAKLFPGVEMVTNMVAGIISQQVPIQYDWNTYQAMAIEIGLGVLWAFLTPFMSIFVLIMSTTTLTIALVASCVALFILKYTYVDMGCLIILVLLQAMVSYSHQFFLEKRQKSKIKQLFGQYVPETYVKELIDSREASASMEGQNRELTVFFSDIRSFTNTSEGLDAVDVKRLLNTFFTPITEIIFNFQGTIDKYVGDMVMAFWGAPIPIPNNGHARNAVMAAMTIFKKLPEINEEMKKNNLPEVNIGIGLGTGLMNVGDMGSKFRRSYTVLGDNVNLASRLESLTKYYGVNILVNDSTRENQDDILWRAVDKVSVKGRVAALTIYEPLGLLSEVSDALKQEIALYHQALEIYYMKDWTEAHHLFSQLEANYPDTKLYPLYLKRIALYKELPPPPNWEGVFVHTEK